MGRRFTRLALLLSLSAVASLLALAVVEGALRLRGWRPWQHRVWNPDAPALCEPDAVLGWRNKSGRYLMRRQVPGAEQVWMTIDADGSRPSGSRKAAGTPRLALVGCSFTFGGGVGDADTFSAKLAERMPALEVKNYGVIGYGTYQSLLRLEQLLAEEPPPARVLYGYLDGHELRSVAHPFVTWSLIAAAERGQAEVPFARLDGDGRLRRYPPTRYPQWPFSRYLASALLFDIAYMQWASAGLAEESTRVTQLLMAEMADRCRARGIEFAVVLLYAGPERKKTHLPFLERSGIRVIDCSRPLTADVTIPGDGHPNERLHAIWADCLADALASTSSTSGRRTP